MDKRKQREYRVTRYNLNTEFEVKGLIHQGAKVFLSNRFLTLELLAHMIPDIVLLQDIQPIQSEVKVQKASVSLFMGLIVFLYLLF
jgi:hypothetical protein